MGSARSICEWTVYFGIIIAIFLITSYFIIFRILTIWHKRTNIRTVCACTIRASFTTSFFRNIFLTLLLECALLPIIDTFSKRIRQSIARWIIKVFRIFTNLNSANRFFTYIFKVTTLSIYSLMTFFFCLIFGTRFKWNTINGISCTYNSF